MRAAKMAVNGVKLAFDLKYSYKIPESFSVEIGQAVFVPFGKCKKPRKAFVLEIYDSVEENLKEVISIDEKTLWPPKYIVRLAEKIAERCFCTVYEVLSAAVPK
jgi:primosomal protein N'